MAKIIIILAFCIAFTYNPEEKIMTGVNRNNPVQTGNQAEIKKAEPQQTQVQPTQEPVSDKEKYKTEFNNFAAKLAKMPAEDRQWQKDRFMDATEKEPLEKINTYLSALVEDISAYENSKNPEDKKKSSELNDLYNIVHFVQKKIIRNGMGEKINKGSAEATMNLIN
jgi:hypothetical protein